MWVAKDRGMEAFEGFFDALGGDRSQGVAAISGDASGISLPVARAVNATICLDPFHVIKWANDALAAFYRATPALPTDDDVAQSKTGHCGRPNWQRLRTALRAPAAVV